MNSFSSKNRVDIIQQINNSSFDLLVIGGGITGAGIALDASARGLKVALIEMQDFASGTSGRSTKLIHGGLRYLKQLELKLVAEVGKERDIVHKNAPHLTKPEPMLLPIAKGGSLNKFTARIAMFVYEIIAGVKKEERHTFLSKEETLKIEPLLKQKDLIGGILFYEYRTDDARLTIEVLKKAVATGTLAINYMKATSFNYTNDNITGANIHDEINGNQYQINAKYIVNACGPWVDEIGDLDQKRNKHKLQITKGIHLVVDWKKLPIKQSAYFDTFDNRMIFVIPREGKTYIGTTDTFYNDDIIHPKITNIDRDYILKCVNDYFPEQKLGAADIESGWAGIRPLVKKSNKGASEISRKDEIFESQSGLITIAGGKLTGYRKMANRIVDIIAKKINSTNKIKISNCKTNNIKLSGGEINKNFTFSEFMEVNILRGIDLGLTKEEAQKLTSRYGSNVAEIFQIIESLKVDYAYNIPIFLFSQLIYSIEKEMCVTPSDFFIRRISSLYFDIELVKEWGQKLVVCMQNIQGWDDNLTEHYSLELQKSINEIDEIKK